MRGSKLCPHCKSAMTRIDGVYALIKVDKSEAGITFYPDRGVPVVVYGCSADPSSACNGVLQLYPAKALGEI